MSNPPGLGTNSVCLILLVRQPDPRNTDVTEMESSNISHNNPVAHAREKALTASWTGCGADSPEDQSYRTTMV